MPVAPPDWRQWTDQQEVVSNTAFPGQLAVTDFENIGASGAGVFTTLLLGPGLGIPTWPYVPTGVNAADPFTGWSAQKETTTNTPRPNPPGL